jgi:beta-aspartyl-peptidase (threonine type)
VNVVARVPSIIVHGGAGADPADRRHALRQRVRTAVEAGWAILARDGRALDAVEAAVRVLEDPPLSHEDAVGMDASIMDGDRLEWGAVGGVTRVSSPITLARRVLERGRPALLVAEGARAFAGAAGLADCPPPPRVAADAGGTVGAVALDRLGTAAAATSSGSRRGDPPGHVGASALIGCGTYADSSLGAVSCSGDDGAIVRVVLARRTLDYLKDAGDPQYAAQVAMDLLVDEGRGEGGVVVLDWRGRTAWAHATPFMPVAWRDASVAAPQVPF